MHTKTDASFYFEFSNQLISNNPESFNNRLTALSKLGSKVIKFNGDGYSWIFVKPDSLTPLECTIHEDFPNSSILFYGSLYSAVSTKGFKSAFREITSVDKLICLLRTLSGSFSGMIFLKKTRSILAFSDQFGIKKLYYHIGPKKTIISSNIMLVARLTDSSCISNLAFSSILYCGHIFCDSILDNVAQVNAACYVSISSGYAKEEEYVKYPKVRNTTFKKAISSLQEVHTGFWERIQPAIGDDIALLLSRGKDARVVLKHMLQANMQPKTFSFYRKDNPLYPFVSFLLSWTDDCDAANQIANSLNVSFKKLQIPNNYLLQNLDRIVELNHGTPLHWEFLAAAELIQSKYTTTGFVGDAIAGKSHHYYLMNKIKTASEYGLIEFRNAGSVDSYKQISNILKETDYTDLISPDEMGSLWQKQYDICNSDDLNIIFQQGLFRTRVLGRTGSTFDQMRLFTHPIYPYLDTSIIEAYRSLPEKYLRWEKAHVALLVDDSRFNSVNTTRLKVTVKQELAMLEILGVLRKADTLMKHKKNSKVNPSKTKDEALKQTLLDLQLDPLAVQKIFALPQTSGFYQTVVNLTSALRIKKSVFNIVKSHHLSK